MKYSEDVVKYNKEVPPIFGMRMIIDGNVTVFYRFKIFDDIYEEIYHFSADLTGHDHKGRINDEGWKIFHGERERKWKDMQGWIKYTVEVKSAKEFAYRMVLSRGKPMIDFTWLELLDKDEIKEVMNKTHDPVLILYAYSRYMELSNKDIKKYTKKY